MVMSSIQTVSAPLLLDMSLSYTHTKLWYPALTLPEYVPETSPDQLITRFVSM